MPTVLAISSSVAASRVGLGIMVPALQALHVEVIAIPTVMFGRHPGWGAPGGAAVDTDLMAAMLEGAAAHPAFAGCDWLITGYFANAEQVDIALSALEQLRAVNPGARYLCDPVMGNAEKKLYVHADVAEAITGRLAPAADLITPNAWELERLTGGAAPSPEAAADLALDELGKATLISSVPDKKHPERLHTVYADGPQAWSAWRERRDEAPDGGLGDALAALFLGYMVQGWSPPDALSAAVGATDAMIDAAIETAAPELPSAGLGALVDAAQPATVQPLAAA